MSNENAIVVPVRAETQPATEQLKDLTNIIQKLGDGVNGFCSSMEKASSSMGKSNGFFSQFSISLVGISAAGKMIQGGLSSLSSSFAAFTDVLSKSSQRTGISVGSLAGLKFAAEQSGASFEDLSNGIRDFQKQLGAAKMGDSGAIDKLGKSGIKADMFEGVTNEDAFLKLAEHIGSIKDSTEQTRVATELFGESGYKLIPLFQSGKEGIKSMTDEAKRLGLVLDDTQISAGVELTDAMNRLKSAFAATGNQLISALAPALTRVSNAFAWTIAQITGLLNYFPRVTSSLGSMLLAISAVTIAIAAYNAVSAIATAMNPWSLAIMGIAAAIGALYGILGPSVTQMQAFSNEAKKQREATDELIDADKKRFERLKELERLSETDTLNNAEVREAELLIKTLTDRYGDLGVGIDKTTGKINGMVYAQKQLAEAQKKQKLSALDAEEKEVMANMALITKKRNDAAGVSSTGQALGWQALTDDYRNQLNAEENALFAQREDINNRRNLIFGIEGKKNADENLNDLTTANKNNREINPEKLAAAISEANSMAQTIESVNHEGLEGSALKYKQIDDKEKKAQAALELLRKNAQNNGDMDGINEIDSRLNDVYTWAKNERTKIKKEQEDKAKTSIKQMQDTANKSVLSAAEKELLTIQEEIDKYKTNFAIANPSADITTDKDAIEYMETQNSKITKIKKDEENRKNKEANRIAELKLKGEDTEDEKVIESRQKVARRENQISSAVLSNNQDIIPKLEKELEKEKMELAKNLAMARGTSRADSRYNYDVEMDKFRELSEDKNASAEDLEKQWNEVEKAKGVWEKDESEYKSAVGDLQSYQQKKQESVINQAKARFESASSRGTFSAFEAGSLGNNVAKQQLDAMQKMLKELIQIQNNTAEGVGVVA